MQRASRKGFQQQHDNHHDVEGGSDDNSKGEKQERGSLAPPPLSQPLKQNSLYLLIPLVAVVTLSLLFLFYTRGPSKNGRHVLMFMIFIPILLAASVAAGAWQAQPHQRLVALAFVGAIICNQLPSSVSAALASLAMILFSLSTRPKEGSSVKTTDASTRQAQLRAVRAALLLVLVLLTDNFFVWVVAATYYPSHAGLPQPLQDNGRLVQQYWFESLLKLKRRDVQQLRATVNIEWALVAGLGAAFVVCELNWIKKSKRTLYSLATHAIYTLAAARFIRVVSFLMTVLPSQMPDCYRHHFPNPPPQDWYSWIQVGLLPNASGGCNDLIVSGHATVTSVLACISASVAGHWAFSLAIWSMLAMDFMIEVYEGFHYSVDMWMGALFTVMLWRILAPIEDAMAPPDGVQKREFYALSDTSAHDVVMHAVPSIGAYLVLAILPQSIANYCVILYFVAALVQIARHGINHYVQHLLFCMLYIALGIYL